MKPGLEARRHRVRCGLGESIGGRARSSRICRRTCPSCRRIRSPGPEYSGPDAGFATLFLNRWCILTPPEGTDEAAVERMRAFWAALGSNVEVMTAQHHDLVLAITSHVPHLIAYNIVGTAADLEEVTQSEVIKFSAGGFRDFTRIAASDPTMWRDVFLHNKEAVLEMLGRFTEDLSRCWRGRSAGARATSCYDLFTRTRDIRRGIISRARKRRSRISGDGARSRRVNPEVSTTA